MRLVAARLKPRPFKAKSEGAMEVVVPARWWRWRNSRFLHSPSLTLRTSVEMTMGGGLDAAF